MMRGSGRGAAVRWWRRLRDAANLLGSVRVVVAGASMEPALRAGDRLLVSRLAFLVRGPRRGGIVVLAGGRYEFRDETDCIKRIVGLPGERLAAGNGLTLVNGRPLPEPYAAAARATPRQEAHDVPREWTLAASEYVVLGDNRAGSRDSRAFGPVRRRDLRGRAWYRYNPPERRGRL